jgi:Holliday junction resolvasome RuvABC endonuclease subunit
VSLKELPVIDAVMGIDLGSYRTGVAALEVGSGARLLHRAKLVVVGESYVERWAETIKLLRQFMADVLKGRPAAIAIEQPNSGQNMQSTRELTGGFGAILYWLHTEGLSAMDVNTAHAKKVFVGKGGGGKVQTIDRANQLYGLALKYHRDGEKSDDDVADAIQVAYTARFHLVAEDPWFMERASRP